MSTAPRWRRLAPLVPAAALIPIVASINYSADLGLAYQGGVSAWASGHPERLATWFSTPFLALVMALVTRVSSVEVAAHVFLAFNVVLWAGLLWVVWNRLHGTVPAAYWWITLVAAGVFAPGITNIFWLQFNLLVFALAVAGFDLVGRHDRWAGVLIGLSLALKPVLILLPIVLLLRRRSRPAGAWSLAAAAALSALGLGFLAWRAGDVRVLDPVSYLTSFLGKGSGPLAGCVIENYSPVAFLCRIGVPESSLLMVAIALGVVAIAWVAVRPLPEGREGDWEAFAAAGLLSPLIGPVDWSSYGLLTAPLFLIVAYQLWRDRGPVRVWAGLVVAFVMAELVWDPLESLARAPVWLLVFSYSVGQFSQYILLLVWLRWRQLHDSAGAAHPLGRLVQRKEQQPSEPPGEDRPHEPDGHRLGRHDAEKEPQPHGLT